MALILSPLLEIPSTKAGARWYSIGSAIACAYFWLVVRSALATSRKSTLEHLAITRL